MHGSVIVRRYPTEKNEWATCRILKALPNPRPVKKFRPFSLKTMNFNTSIAAEGRFKVFKDRLFRFLHIDLYRPTRITISDTPLPRSIRVKIMSMDPRRGHYGFYSIDGKSGCNGPCHQWLEWMIGKRLEGGEYVWVQVKRIPYKKG